MQTFVSWVVVLTLNWRAYPHTSCSLSSRRRSLLKSSINSIAWKSSHRSSVLGSSASIALAILTIRNRMSSSSMRLYCWLNNQFISLIAEYVASSGAGLPTCTPILKYSILELLSLLLLSSVVSSLLLVVSMRVSSPSLCPSLMLGRSGIVKYNWSLACASCCCLLLFGGVASFFWMCGS